MSFLKTIVVITARAHCFHNCIYIYIFILLIHIVPERNLKHVLSGILVILSVAITFSLAYCELNYAPFWCIWGICPNLRKLLKKVS